MRRMTWWMLAIAIGLLPAWSSKLVACPFCAAASQTFSEEMGSMDAVVIARLISSLPQSPAGNLDQEVPKAKFQIEQVIKGQELLGDRKVIETIFFGDAKKGQLFLIMGVDPPNLMWSTPLAISERVREYLIQLPKLPDRGPDRLAFFQQYFEDEDELLARDAYDEFAKAPYDEVKALKDRMNHDQLVEWIESPDVPASRRRLYLTMLGVCGTEKDLPILEQMLRSNDRQMKAGLDALIACYLTLKGPDGLPLIEELFLKNPDAEYADTYAAIMALRFHGTQEDVIPRQRILQSLHYMLDRPQLADLVIPDLAKWEDWSVMEKLVQLFKEADEKSSWVRVPVINYLRACPLPEAKQYIDELEKIDPEAVKRARTFFPFAPEGEKASSADGQTTQEEAVAIAPSNLTDENGQQDAVAEGATTAPVAASTADEQSPAKGEQSATSHTESAQPAPPPASPPAASAAAAQSSNTPWPAIVILVVAGTILVTLYWTILRGARGRPVT